MQIKPTKLVAALIGAAVLTLAGCGGGGDSATSTPAVTTTAVTVSPSLGRFTDGAHVTIKKLDGTVLGTADIAGGLGKAVVSIPTSYTGPILVEVTGKDDGTGTYYDEGSKSFKPFLKAEKLRAIAGSVLAALGVTPATNAAVVELETTKGSLAGANADDIANSNSKIQAALGILDILQAPTLVDDKTASSLNLVNKGDVYALVLAALAKQGIATGKTALDVAKDLANDLSDGKIDGLKGSTALTDLAYTPATFITDMATQKIAAASELADTTTKSIVNSDSSALGTVDTDVTDVTIPAGTNITDLQKAKAFFAELRTTLQTLVNSSGSGFLETQATKAGDDLQATIAPELDKVATRLDALSLAAKFYENVKGIVDHGMVFKAGIDPTNPKKAVFIYEDGNIKNTWYGFGSYNQCWTDSASTGLVGKVTCANFNKTSADRANSQFKFVVYTVTSPTNTAGQYAYTATRYNQGATYSNGSVTTPDLPTLAKNALLSTSDTPVYIPAGSGTFSMTRSGTQVTAVSLNGTLPPSTSICVAPNANSIVQQSKTCPPGQIQIPGTGVDTVAINATRTALASNTYRYALSGLVSTVNAVDTTKVSSISLDSGSSFDADETDAATTGSLVTAAVLKGTAQTAANKFTGTITMDSFVTDKSGQDRIPSNIMFDGSISDISTGGAGQFLTGKVVYVVTSYSDYDISATDTFSNYEHATVTFTGKVQVPSRPLMTLVLSSTATGPNGLAATTLSFSYDNISITGSRAEPMAGGLPTILLSNQDGVSIAIDNNSDALVTKSGATLATITGNTIKYIDGSSASLN